MYELVIYIILECCNCTIKMTMCLISPKTTFTPIHAFSAFESFLKLLITLFCLLVRSYTVKFMPEEKQQPQMMAPPQYMQPPPPAAAVPAAAAPAALAHQDNVEYSI